MVVGSDNRPPFKGQDFLKPPKVPGLQAKTPKPIRQQNNLY